ncbi:hypothetical protein HN873_059161 [Arachis hypogaea]
MGHFLLPTKIVVRMRMEVTHFVLVEMPLSMELFGKRIHIHMSISVTISMTNEKKEALMVSPSSDVLISNKSLQVRL